MKKVAVILSGCGVFDGAEINEVVLTLLQIAKQGASYQCFAPDITQMHTLNHLTGEEMPEQRNVLVEAARIVRGDIKALDELDVDAFDALIVPGGFGVAKNLSNFALQGENLTVNEQVLQACKAFAVSDKPTGYMCIAPAILPVIYGQGIKLTIGNDVDTSEVLTRLGAEHIHCAVDEIVTDLDLKVVTTPAYMLANTIVEAEQGISKLVSKVLAFA